MCGRTRARVPASQPTAHLTCNPVCRACTVCSLTRFLTPTVRDLCSRRRLAEKKCQAAAAALEAVAAVATPRTSTVAMVVAPSSFPATAAAENPAAVAHSVCAAVT
eukprot:6746612-Prymnesium_polylepis.1